MIVGLMLDSARCMDSPAYYRRAIRFCADWGYNTLMFNLADDQGSAFHFRRYPEFSSPQALEPETWRALVRYAEGCGVDLIPVIESLGHTGFITSTERFAHLNDTPPNGHNFTGICPLAEETISILADLYEEVARVFTGPWLHIGCDEVVLGAHRQTQQALEEMPLWRLFGEYVARLHEVVQGVGRQTIIWGDHPLKEPRIFDLLPREITVMDWAYWPEVEADHVRAPVERGFPTIAAPALIWFGAGVRPGTRNLENVAEMAARARAYNALGTVTTVWFPTRYQPEVLWPAVALAGALMRGEDPAVTRDAFVCRYWQATPTDVWRRALQLCFDTAPQPADMAALYPVTPEAWRDLPERLAACRAWQPALDEAAELLAVCLSEAGDHREALSALAFSVELQRYGLRRAGQLLELARKPAASALRALARRDERMHRRLQAEWRRGREAHDIRRYWLSRHGRMADNLFGLVALAAGMSARWAENPETIRMDLPC